MATKKNAKCNMKGAPTAVKRKKDAKYEGGKAAAAVKRNMRKTSGCKAYRNRNEERFLDVLGSAFMQRASNT